MQEHDDDSAKEPANYDALSRLGRVNGYGKFDELENDSQEDENDTPDLTRLGIQEVYSLIGKGQGGFASVYHCRSAAFGEVAAKVFSLGCNFREGFQNVVSALHPNLVGILSVVESASLGAPSCIICELCGRTLHDVLHTDLGSTIPVVDDVYERLSAAIDVGQGLKYLHSKRIMHRNVSSSKCFLGRSVNAESKSIGFVKLGGFSTIRKADTSRTDMTKWVGNAFYMSPEKAEGGEDYGLPSDVYSYGILVYEIICRRIPYGNEYPEQGQDVRQAAEVLMFVAQGGRPDVNDVPGSDNPSARTKLISLLPKLWMDNPKQRPRLADIEPLLLGIRSEWKMTPVIEVFDTFASLPELSAVDE